MEELKRCPFCGGEAYKKIEFPTDSDGLEMNMYTVGCSTCGVQFSVLWDEECVTNFWNDRPTEAEIRNKTIDEFAERLKASCKKPEQRWHIGSIAEQMKEVE